MQRRAAKLLLRERKDERLVPRGGQELPAVQVDRHAKLAPPQRLLRPLAAKPLRVRLVDVDRRRLLAGP